MISGHWGLIPKMQKLAIENKIEAYNFPQGCLAHMLRNVGAHKPRTISSVGLGTYIDPRNGGGKINDKTTEDLVELIEFDGQEYLAYKPSQLMLQLSAEPRLIPTAILQWRKKLLHWKVFLFQPAQ